MIKNYHFFRSKRGAAGSRQKKVHTPNSQNIILKRRATDEGEVIF